MVPLATLQHFIQLLCLYQLEMPECEPGPSAFQTNALPPVVLLGTAAPRAELTWCHVTCHMTSGFFLEEDMAASQSSHYHRSSCIGGSYLMRASKGEEKGEADRLLNHQNMMNKRTWWHQESSGVPFMAGTQGELPHCTFAPLVYHRCKAISLDLSYANNLLPHKSKTHPKFHSLGHPNKHVDCIFCMKVP